MNLPAPTRAAAILLAPALLVAVTLTAARAGSRESPDELTSRNTRHLRTLLRWYPEADANADGVLTQSELDAYRPPPQHRDVPYDDHAKQTLDLYLTPSQEPTPLVIYIHGGGFRGGDKGNIWPDLINRCHAAGVSVASVNYRLLPEFVFPAPFEDGARAVQFLRHHAARYNLDPQHFAATGVSAGGGIGLWLALHDDLADTQGNDPVGRQSTRLSAASVVNAQVSYDPRFYEEHGLVVEGQDAAALGLNFYGLKTGEALTPQLAAVAEQCAAINHVSQDDPPVYVHYVVAGSDSQRGVPRNRVLPHDPKGDDVLHDVLPPRSRSDAVHHPEQARILRRQARQLGVPVYIMAPPRDTAEIDFLEFLITALRDEPLPRQAARPVDVGTR